MLGLADVGGALEHDVLEEVREPRLARDFVLRADVVPEVHGDDGGKVIFSQDVAQAVGQPLIGKANHGGGHTLANLRGACGDPRIVWPADAGGLPIKA